MFHRSALVSVMCAAALAASGPAIARADSRSPLHGTLARGAHDVGFTRLQMADATRPSGPKRAGSGAADVDRSRKLDVHVWYPARGGSAIAPMTFADAMVAHLAGRPATDLAMRHPDVDAVCDLESAIFDDRMMFPLSRGWGYDTSALRVPFLHTYSVPLSKLENRIGDFEAMRYSTRYRYLVDAPGIHHWDFATEGMAASAVLGVRGQNGPALQQAFEMTNRYVLQFFNAYVKHDRDAVAFLRRDPQANGAPAGLVSVREHLAIQPAPTLEAVEAMVRTRGIDAAVREIDAARAVDPQAALFREPSLNRLGYRLLRGQKLAESIVIFRKVVDLFPGSANAHDSLSEALEAAGERAQSVEVAQKGLEVLSKQDLTPEQKREMANLLEARLKRLR